MKVSIPVNLNTAEEPKPVPVGRYNLIIASAESKNSQAGKPMIVASMGIEGHENAPNVTHFISLPAPGDEKSAFKALSLRRFLEAFQIPYTEGVDGNTDFDTDDFLGASASLELGLSEPDAETGTVYNRLKLPKLRGENAANERRSPPPPKR